MTHYPGSRFAGILAIVAVSGLLLRASPVSAHHSTAEYDPSVITESRGEVVSVLWRNPHVRFEVSTASLDGNEQLWEIESADLTRLDRAGLPRDLLQVGDVVSFAGNPSTRKARRMYVTNLLLADGREILLRNNVEPRWSPARAVDTDGAPPATTAADRAAGPAAGAAADPAGTAADRAAGAAADSAAGTRSFFGKVLIPTREGRRPAWLADPPLTEAAREGRAAYDAVTDDPVLGCVSPGMPRVMTRSGPYAIRFLERGDDIVLQNEWFEIDRVIRMDGREPPADLAHTPLGYSAGRWDGDSLVITTTHIDWPYFQLYGLEGIPQSRAMRIVERFTPSEDGTALIYDISATDPETFTETVTYEGYVTFRWNPALEFLPYDCIEEERRARNAR